MEGFAIEKIAVTSTTSPEEISFEESLSKRMRKMKSEEESLETSLHSETVQPIAQKLPDCNKLEREMKMDNIKQEDVCRWEGDVQGLTVLLGTVFIGLTQ